MKKVFVIFLLVGIFILFLLAFSFISKKPTATINNHIFSIEIAATQQQQTTGLAKYASLPTDHAMYFPFSKPDYYSFWMKGMRFPIDILFIRNNKIISVFNSVPVPMKDSVSLPTYQPRTPADSVLEINAGLSKKYGFKVGDSVQLAL